MKQKLLKEEFQRLEEFIQKISSIITPISFREELKAVMDKNTRRQLSEKYPKCWMPINIGSKEVPFLPLCNRQGANDHRMIAFSLKLCRRLNSREDIDQGMLEITMKKLERMHVRFAQDIPKPYTGASQKGKVTKALHGLKIDLQNIRNNI